MDKSHLSDSTSTTITLNETCHVNTSCDHLIHMDPPSTSSELQGNSIVGSTEPESIHDLEGLLEFDSTSVSSLNTSRIETESLPEFEGQLDHTNLSPIDVFSGHHDYELFLLQKEIDAPYDNLSHHDTHVYEKHENQDDILIHATHLSDTFAIHISWHNTTMKAWSPLIIQVQFQPLFKLLGITPSIIGVLISQWQLSAINLNTLTLATTLHNHNSWHNQTSKT